MGVIRACVEWRCYLEGGQFPVTIVTDHNPLTFFSSQSVLSRRQARWSEFLHRFALQWRYIPGRSNMADPLSRCPQSPTVHSISLLPGPPAICCASKLSQVKVSLKNQLVSGYAQDPWFSKQTNLQNLQQDGQQLWRLAKGKGELPLILVPNVDSVKYAILRELHDSPFAGHPGPQRTVLSVKRWFTWPGMVSFITNYVQRCRSCQQMKPSSVKPAGPCSPCLFPITLGNLFPWICLPVSLPLRLDLIPLLFGWTG